MMLTHSQTGWTYTRLFLLELSDLGLICLHNPILEVYNISICFFFQIINVLHVLFIVNNRQKLSQTVYTSSACSKRKSLIKVLSV